jgi:quinol monooxygenase YgiN
MNKVALIAKLTAAEGKRDELVEALKAAIDAVAGEEKTEVYALHLDAGDEHRVWFYELYTDQDGFSTHSTGDAMKALGGVGSLMGERPELIFLTPVAAKGLTFV